jgi:HNH endonuclease
VSAWTKEAHAAAMDRFREWVASVGGQAKAGKVLGLCQATVSGISRGLRPPARWDVGRLEDLTGIPAWSWDPPKQKFTRRKVDVAERFAAKLRAMPSGCVEFSGQRDHKGYGRFWDGVTKGLAHRYAWTSARGEIGEGLHVCHACDNPPCCNVDHLFLGTNADNVADAVAKGRPRGAAITPMRGERNPRAKLTDAQAVEVKRLLGMPRYHGHLADIGRRFGVAAAVIANIRDGRAWASVGT